MTILPIVTYNDPVLRKKAEPVRGNSEQLQQLIDNLYETMYNASGVGLAAPQVGSLQQLFVIDADTVTEDLDEADMGPMVFINPEIVRTSGENVTMEEGCLSIPEVRDEVKRPQAVEVSWLNREFEHRKMEFTGWVSRVIQHEYDHLQGTLFLDHLSAFRRRLHKKHLQSIDTGTFETDYPLVSKSASDLT